MAESAIVIAHVNLKKSVTISLRSHRHVKVSLSGVQAQKEEYHDSRRNLKTMVGREQ